MLPQTAKCPEPRSLPPSVKKEEKTDLLHKDRKRNEEYQPTFRHIGFFPTQKSTL